MPLPGPKRWEKAPAEKTTSHHVLSMADKPRNPTQVLVGTQAELKFNVVEKLKHVAVKDLGVPTGRHDQIVEVLPFDLGDCPRATLLKFVSVASR